jgi:hypothetical protein
MQANFRSSTLEGDSPDATNSATVALLSSEDGAALSA